MVITATIAAESGTKLLLPAANELFWGAVSFIVLFLLLAKFAYPSASKALKDRSDKIRTDIESAEQDRDEAARMLADYREQLSVARAESNRILEDARKTAEQLRRDLQTKAEEEAARLLDRAREDIAGERERAVAEIRREVGSLAVDLAGRVIGDSLDRDRQLALVDRYIEDLPRAANGDDGGGA